MPRKNKAEVKPSLSLRDSLNQLNIHESYISLMLGFLVVIFAAAVTLVSFKSVKLMNFRDQLFGQKKVFNETKTTPIKSQKETTKKVETYKVQADDLLWDIAVKFYDDGNRWVEIAKVNSLENPDIIEPGTVLKIPR